VAGNKKNQLQKPGKPFYTTPTALMLIDTSGLLVLLTIYAD
jgi:hypothetical protein